MTPKDEGYGSMMREIWKRSASQPAGYKSAKMIPTWWDQNNHWIGQVCWALVVAFFGIEIIILYGTKWPR